MAGEYQLAQEMIDKGIETARQQDGMDEEMFARALMYQLIEHARKTRSSKDIIGELEQHIRYIEDEGDAVVTRGC